MKIAQIAPLMESVPPRLYGGTERIVSYLTDELVRLGHEVTLFASADSVMLMLVDTMDEAVMMLPRVIALDRRAVRRRFEQRFSSARMANDYVAVYRSLLKRPSISERETTVPLPRPVLPKELNGNGRHGDRGRRLPQTVDLVRMAPLGSDLLEV